MVVEDEVVVVEEEEEEEDSCLVVEAIKGHVWDDRVRLWAFGP